jgi:hypothetical protein
MAVNRKRHAYRQVALGKQESLTLDIMVPNIAGPDEDDQVFL